MDVSKGVGPRVQQPDVHRCLFVRLYLCRLFLRTMAVKQLCNNKHHIYELASSNSHARLQKYVGRFKTSSSEIWMISNTRIVRPYSYFIIFIYLLTFFFSFIKSLLPYKTHPYFMRVPLKYRLFLFLLALLFRIYWNTQTYLK